MSKQSLGTEARSVTSVSANAASGRGSVDANSPDASKKKDWRQLDDDDELEVVAYAQKASQFVKSISISIPKAIDVEASVSLNEEEEDEAMFVELSRLQTFGQEKVGRVSRGTSQSPPPRSPSVERLMNRLKVLHDE